MSISNINQERAKPLGFNSPAGYLISEKEFNGRVSGLIEDGNRLNYRMEAVADELETLVRQYPDYATNAKLPNNYNDILEKVVRPKRFQSKNITPQTDPAKTFTIVIKDDADHNGKSFGAKMIITKGTGESIMVDANTWSSTFKEAGKELTSGIIEGTFPAVYSKHGHKNGTKPGLRINNGGMIQTVDPNPVREGEYFAKTINVHCGGQTSRGSEGCNTIQKDDCQKVWDFLPEGATGTVTIIRSKEAPNNFWGNKK